MDHSSIKKTMCASVSPSSSCVEVAVAETRYGFLLPSVLEETTGALALIIATIKSMDVHRELSEEEENFLKVTRQLMAQTDSRKVRCGDNDEGHLPAGQNRGGFFFGFNQTTRNRMERRRRAKRYSSGTTTNNRRVWIPPKGDGATCE